MQESFDMTRDIVTDPGPGKGEILVVDDSRDSLQLLSRILSAEGYRVRLAVNGELALDSIRARQPDLVLLDVRLPDINGFEVCRRLKEDENTRNIPVLFITVLDSVEDKVKGFEAGGIDYIVKPFQQAEVLARVNTHVCLSRMCNKLEQLVEERTRELEKINRQLQEEIASRKQAEAEKQLLFEAINQSSETVVITDPDGNIVFVNPAFERRTGYSKEEVIGRNPRLLKSGHHDQEFYEQLWSTILGGETWQGEFINKKKDGSLFIEKASISPVFDPSGKISNFIAVKLDITEQRHLEEQLRHAQKMESVGRLAGGVAHDYNNTLQIILGYLQLLLLRDDLPDDVSHHLKQIQTAAEHASKITGQLLAFSRRQTVCPKVLDLNDLLSRGILPMLEQLIGEDIELAFLPKANPATIEIDPGQVQQLVSNLVINARDAMPQGGKLTIQTANAVLDEQYCKEHPGARPGEYVVMTVTDTGCGIDPEIMPYIFEPFFTTKDRHKGTGLGLPSVYGIVKQGGGYITVKSEPGTGTTFKIYFPLHEESDDFCLASEEQEAVKGDISSLRILLVEDNEMVRDLTKEMLELLGHCVVAADDPANALDMARQMDHIDLLLTDIVMPGMSGKQLFEKIRDIFPNVKVLFMSGYTCDVIARHGVVEKGVNFIQKPFSMKKLAEKIKITMAGKGGSTKPEPSWGH